MFPRELQPIISSSWPRALTLAERQPLFRQHIRDCRTTTTRFNLDHARESIVLWRELPGLSDDARFHALMEAQRLTPDEFELMLSVPAEALAAHLDAPPGWLGFASTAPNDTPVDIGDAAVDRPALGMLWPVEPMLREGARRLQRELRRIEEQGCLAPSGREAALQE